MQFLVLRFFFCICVICNFLYRILHNLDMSAHNLHENSTNSCQSLQLTLKVPKPDAINKNQIYFIETRRYISLPVWHWQFQFGCPQNADSVTSHQCVDSWYRVHLLSTSWYFGSGRVKGTLYPAVTTLTSLIQNKFGNVNGLIRNSSIKDVEYY